MNNKINFEEHTGLVVHTIKKMFKGMNNAEEIANRRSMSVDDLIQVGMIVLWKSSMSFNETKGLQFSTYASKAIRNGVLNEINRKHIVKMPLKMDNREKDKLSRAISIHEKINKESTIEDIIKTNFEFEDDLVVKCDIEDMLSCLSDKYKTVLKLRINDHSFASIAKKIDTSEKNAGKIFHKAIKKLKSNFDYVI